MTELYDKERDNLFGPDNGENIDDQIKKEIRMGFIRKVYGIIFFQVLLTCATVITSIFYIPLATFLIQNENLVVVCSLIALVINIIIVCNCCKLSTKVPINYILLFMFTICESLIVSFICQFYERESVFRIALITFALVLSISLYACFTKTDFTFCGYFLAIIGMSLFILSIIIIFFHSPILDTITNGCECILFCFYLIYDTQLVIGNKENMIKEDDYINGALQIYVDIIVLFIKLLKLFGKRKK